jgi:hypothetical protein
LAEAAAAEGTAARLGDGPFADVTESTPVKPFPHHCRGVVRTFSGT